jgi:hypothetical protein
MNFLKRLSRPIFVRVRLLTHEMLRRWPSTVTQVESTKLSAELPAEMSAELPTESPNDVTKSTAVLPAVEQPEPQDTAETAAAVGPMPLPETGADSLELLVELATGLWYLKTKFFKRQWDQFDSSDDDPRVRRALSRIDKSIEALRNFGIEVHDVTGMRYPPGGEAMMRPVDFLPSDDVAFDIVVETVTPIVFQDDVMLQRGEVFVAVPRVVSAELSESAIATAEVNGSKADETSVAAMAVDQAIAIEDSSADPVTSSDGETLAEEPTVELCAACETRQVDQQDAAPDTSEQVTKAAESL